MVTEATPANVKAMLPMQDTLINLGNSILLGTDATFGISYSWYNNDSLIDTTAQITVNPSATATYIRKMSWCNNIVYDTVQVVVNAIQEKDTDNNVFVVLPNPADVSISIQFENQMTKASFKIYDSTGREVLFINNLQQNQSIDISELGVGLYVVKVEIREGEFVKRIFVIKK
jgi:hypothetical protein